MKSIYNRSLIIRMQHINGLTQTSRCLPRVVNPGSIFARVSSVLTTSSLFIYNCRHLSIRFWTCKRFLNNKRNRLVQTSFFKISGPVNIHSTRCREKVEKWRIVGNTIYPYQLNILSWNLFAIIAWSRSWTWVCDRSISRVIVWLLNLGLMRSLSWRL